MLPEKQLGAVLRKIAGVPIGGPFSRAVALHYLFPKPAPAPRVKPQPLWGLGSKRFGGRYTPKNSFETIYMAKDMVTALAEAQAIISNHPAPAFTIATAPWAIVAIEGIVASTLDLTVLANVQAIGSSYQELTGAWRSVPGHTGEPPTHLLGRLCHNQNGSTVFAILQARMRRLACVWPSFPIACASQRTLRSTIRTATWRSGCSRWRETPYIDSKTSRLTVGQL